MNQSHDEYTHFGYKTVHPNTKPKLVNEVFSSVASKYDVMNDLMSFGVHRLWRKQFMEFFSDYSGDLLDIAGGNGDIAINYFLKARERGNFPKVSICDINQNMLELAKSNIINKNLFKSIDLVICDATNLPFENNSFDITSIAFGLRNVVDIRAALRESFRILKPGGKFLCLELSQVDADALKPLYDFYSFNIIPKVGKFITKSEDSYQYLVESIRKFPKKEEVVDLMTEAGFNRADYKSLTFGVAAIYYGYK